jgi:hypothetical protein
MSSGALTQLIASGGGGPYMDQIQSTNTDFEQPILMPPILTFVCLNDMCMINNPSLYGSLPSFSSLEDCQKVCGTKPSSLRQQ